MTRFFRLSFRNSLQNSSAESESEPLEAKKTETEEESFDELGAEGEEEK